jgi:hypothetical protein
MRSVGVRLPLRARLARIDVRLPGVEGTDFTVQAEFLGGVGFDPEVLEHFALEVRYGLIVATDRDVEEGLQQSGLVPETL